MRCLFGASPVAVIQPFVYEDAVSENTVAVSVSRHYSKITIDRREFFFVRETGELDGVSTTEQTGPILVCGEEE